MKKLAMLSLFYLFTPALLSAQNGDSHSVYNNLVGMRYNNAILKIDPSLTRDDIRFLCNSDNKCVALFKTHHEPDYSYVVNFDGETDKVTSILRLEE